MTNHAQTAPAVFQFQSQELRVITINNEPWFVASDICRGLEIADAAQAVRQIQKQLNDADLKGAFSKRTLVQTTGGVQEMTCVNEAGVNLLVMQSRKREAMPYKWWVASEVLPSIRKTGSYTLTINNEQQQAIKDLINRVVNETGLTHGGLYARFHNKFKIPRYQELPAVRFDEAIAYLQAKLPQAQMFYGLRDGRYFLHIENGQANIKNIENCAIISLESVAVLRRNTSLLNEQMRAFYGEASTEMLGTSLENLPEAVYA